MKTIHAWFIAVLIAVMMVFSVVPIETSLVSNTAIVSVAYAEEGMMPKDNVPEKTNDKFNIAGEDFLDGTMKHFQALALKAMKNLRPIALWLWAILGVIEICTIWSLYEGRFRLSEMISLILKLSFYLFLILHWHLLCDSIIDFFQRMGELAGSSEFTKAGIDLSGKYYTVAQIVNSPTAILNTGFYVARLLWEQCTIANIFGSLLRMIALIITLVGFFIMSFEVFVTNLELDIFMGLSIFLLPLNVCKFTKGFGQNLIQGLIGYAAKLMVITFLIALIFANVNMTNSGLAEETTTFADDFKFAFIVLSLALLVLKAGSIAQSLISGGGPTSGSGDLKAVAAGVAGYGMGALRGSARLAGKVSAAVDKRKQRPSGGGGDGGIPGAVPTSENTTDGSNKNSQRNTPERQGFGKALQEQGQKMQEHGQETQDKSEQMDKAADTANATGAGAGVGVPLKAAAETGKVAGKAEELAGKGVEASGKAAEEAEKAAEAAKKEEDSGTTVNSQGEKNWINSNPNIDMVEKSMPHAPDSEGMEEGIVAAGAAAGAAAAATKTASSDETTVQQAADKANAKQQIEEAEENEKKAKEEAQDVENATKQTQSTDTTVSQPGVHTLGDEISDANKFWVGSGMMLAGKIVGGTKNSLKKVGGMMAGTAKNSFENSKLASVGRDIGEIVSNSSVGEKIDKLKETSGYKEASNLVKDADKKATSAMNTASRMKDNVANSGVMRGVRTIAKNTKPYGKLVGGVLWDLAKYGMGNSVLDAFYQGKSDYYRNYNQRQGQFNAEEASKYPGGNV